MNYKILNQTFVVVAIASAIFMLECINWNEELIWKESCNKWAITRELQFGLTIQIKTWNGTMSDIHEQLASECANWEEHYWSDWMNIYVLLMFKYTSTATLAVIQ